MQRNYNGWVVVSEGPENVFSFCGSSDAVPADLPVSTFIRTGSFAYQVKNGTMKKYSYHEYDGWQEVN